MAIRRFAGQFSEICLFVLLPVLADILPAFEKGLRRDFLEGHFCAVLNGKIKAMGMAIAVGSIIPDYLTNFSAAMADQQNGKSNELFGILVKIAGCNQKVIGL